MQPWNRGATGNLVRGTWGGACGVIATWVAIACYRRLGWHLLPTAAATMMVLFFALWLVHRAVWRRFES